MSSWNNDNKNNASTPSNVARNNANPFGYVKSGQSPNYDSQLTYDGDTPDGQAVHYDAIGTAPVISNQSKN